MLHKTFTGWTSHKKEYLKIEEVLAVRAELHLAIQIVGAAGRSYSPHSYEDEYGSLRWRHDSDLLVSEVIGTQQRIFASLSMSEFMLGVFKEDGSEIASLYLTGKSFIDAVNWLRKVLNDTGLDGTMLSMDLPYEIPEYQTKNEKEFQLKHEKVFSEFSMLYKNAVLVLDYFKGKYKRNATEIKCWPHHFDIAIQLIYDDESEPGQKIYIGLGLSPGDEKFNRPYYYINLWPFLELKKHELSSLSAGSWNTTGWFGATLDIQYLEKIKEASHQAKVVKDYYDITLNEIFKLINKKS